MIYIKDNCFYLHTANTSYIFRVTKFNHLEQVYFGRRVYDQQNATLGVKRIAQYGSSVLYRQSDMFYCLDQIPLEYSGNGQGDFRVSPIEIVMPDGSYNSDFVYSDYRIVDGHIEMSGQPHSFGKEGVQTLVIGMDDQGSDVKLELIYTVYSDVDVITRRVRIINNDNPIVINKIMSMQLDLPNKDYQLLKLAGGWIKESHKHVQKIEVGQIVNSSTTGGSSNRHNPAIALFAKGATEDYGACYGFNIIYSGNHYSNIELSNHNLLRVVMGINPHCFNVELSKNESFETPEVVMTFANEGLNQMSDNMHRFINNHLTPPYYRDKARPIVYNHWEATFMDFNESKLLKHAKEAAKLGMEMFVIDDGWFGVRNNDQQGLGDYNINRKKFKQGLSPFIKKVNDLGMDVGLWFEPEMISVDSDLFRKHPEYAIKVPNKEQTMGRNQLVLDLCNPDVRDYIVNNMIEILEHNNLKYVKWDMNRHISDAYSANLSNQGIFYHNYILGLYDILARVFKPRPEILLETCSSGGNRFDLGMLYYGSQVWSSDNTDPIERIMIQEGLSYFYPLSTISAHVSNAPHQQTLRGTPLSTRGNVASFGMFGYEYDLGLLNSEERKEIIDQIEFYKEYRDIFQYGRFYRNEVENPDQRVWQVTYQGTSIVGFFQTKTKASPGFDYLRVQGLVLDKQYQMTSKKQRLMIARFGDLINHILPVKVNPNGILVNTVNKYYSIDDANEEYIGSGAMFASGIYLNNQFVGSWYNENIRLLSDFGSTLYVVKEIENE